MTGPEELKARAYEAIDRHADWITAVSDHVLRHPETGFNEQQTSRFVSDQFEKMGLDPEGGLALTGVKARMQGRRPGPTVAILGELDSLLVADHPHANPDTGAAHACGHNAQLASMIGAGLGLQAVLQELDGDVVLFGVPAEECIEVEQRLELADQGRTEFIVGKPELVRLGAFDDVDLAMLTHTGTFADTGPAVAIEMRANGSLVKLVRYQGRAAHAGATPWEGVNALKAAMLGISAIDALRDTFNEADSIRVSQILTQGGQAVSAVPGEATLQVMVRGRTVDAIRDASMKVDRALQAGAMALGAEVEVRTVGAYLPYKPDAPLADVTFENATQLLGADRVLRDFGTMGGSTDVGDLGHLMPVVHPMAAAGNAAPFHSSAYWTVDHALAAVNPARIMAATVIDLLSGGAGTARRVIEESGPKLSTSQYLALRRSMDVSSRFPA